MSEIRFDSPVRCAAAPTTPCALAAPERTARPAFPDQRGLALVSVLLVTTMMFALGVLGAQTSHLSLRIAHNDLLTKQALVIAESGIDHGLGLLRADIGTNGFNDGFDDDLASNGTGGGLASIGSIQQVSGDPYRFRSFGDRGVDGYYVRLVDNFDETTGANDTDTDNDLSVRIVSTGRVDGAERTIEAIVKASPLFPRGLFGDLWVHFTGTADTDSYDSRVSPYPNGPGNNGDVGTNGDMTVNSNSTSISGSASAVGTVSDPHHTVQGQVLTGAGPIVLPPVPACGPPYSNSTGISGGSYDQSTGDLTTGSPPSHIALSPGVYCFHSITLTSNRNLTITGNVTIFLTGKADLTAGHFLNVGTPPQLQIYSSYSGTDTGVQLQGGVDSKIAVYAPKANVIITGGGDLYGGAVGKTVVMNGNGVFHYDEALGMLAGDTLTVTGWREARRM